MDAPGMTNIAAFLDAAAELDPGRPALILDDLRSSVQDAVYVQDEVKLARWVIVNAGLRYDGYEAFSRVTVADLGRLLSDWPLWPLSIVSVGPTTDLHAPE